MSAGLDRFAEEVDAPMAPRIVPMVPTMQLGRWEGGRTSVVHRLQRERGVTCGWVASGGRLFTALLQPARDSTDLTQPTAPITAVVARIRSDADAAVAAVAAAEQQGDTAAAEAARAGMAIAFYDIFRRWNRLLQRALDASADEVVAAARIAPAIGAQTEEASADSPNGREELPIPAELRPQAELSPPAFDGGSPLDPSSQTAFAAFAHLKEATGIERAFLCGALALPEAALPRLPTRAFADLVIGMQQQRAYEDRVKRVAPPRLLELLNAGFVLEPELRELQDRLLLDFDVSSLRRSLSAEACWAMMTRHLDKLETLQFLLYNDMLRAAIRKPATQADGPPMLSVRPTPPSSLPLLAAAGLGPPAPGAEYKTVEKKTAGGGVAGGEGDAAARLLFQAVAGAMSAGEAARAVGAVPAEVFKAAVMRMLAAGGGGGMSKESIEGDDVAVANAEPAAGGVGDASPAGDGQGSATLDTAAPAPIADAARTAAAGAASAGDGGAGVAGGVAAEGRVGMDGGVAAEGRVGMDGGVGKTATCGVVGALGAAPSPDVAWQTDETWRVSLDRLLFERRVGAGAAGTTYRATLDSTTTVCVKVAGGGGAEQASWRTEVELLTRLRHPNIVRCLGVLIEPPTIGLVLEFISGHDLTRALRKPTPPGFALGVARGVACGMEHLHSRGILHRDLKGGNIMVGYGTGTGTADRKRHGQNSPERNSVGANGADGPGREQRNSFGPQGRCVGGAPAGGGGGAGGGGDTSAGEGGGASTAGGGGGGVGGGCAASPLSELQVKIIDLGLAAPAPDESVGGWLTAETGTYRWMAPEVILNERYSRPADVYSYAMVLFEVLTHQVPFADRPSIQAAISCAVNRDRPRLPPGIPPVLLGLVTQCMHAAPAKRPAFAQIKKAVDALLAPGGLTPDQVEWLDEPDGHPVYSAPSDGV